MIMIMIYNRTVIISIFIFIMVIMMMIYNRTCRAPWRAQDGEEVPRG